MGEGSGKQGPRGNAGGRLCTMSHHKAGDFSEREKKLLDGVEWRRILI